METWKKAEGLGQDWCSLRWEMQTGFWHQCREWKIAPDIVILSLLQSSKG